MSNVPVPAEIVSTPLSSSPSPCSLHTGQFDLTLARPFIYKSVSDETRAAYTRAIREFFQFVGNPRPEEVTPAHVINYRDHLRVNKRRKANTVATKLAIVRSFFEYLKAGGVIQLNPASTKLVTPPELPTEPRGRALTPKEVRHLLSGPDRSKPEGARDYAMMLIMLRLSLRLAEVSALQVSAIRFQPLVNYRSLVFDKPLSPRMVQKIVAHWGEFTGLGRVTPHDLRRTVVTKLLNDGRSYREVQMVTKHRDPKTIMRYDHARENLDSSPVNTLTWEEDNA